MAIIDKKIIKIPRIVNEEIIENVYGKAFCSIEDVKDFIVEEMSKTCNNFEEKEIKENIIPYDTIDDLFFDINENKLPKDTWFIWAFC